MRVGRPRVPIAGVVGVLFVAAFAAWFAANFERTETDVDVGYQGAARLNPLLAAERLYTELGVPAKTAITELKLPGAGDALVLVSPRQTMSKARAREILAWVGKGGHLVVTPPDSAAGLHADPLLSIFGVKAFEPSGKKDARDVIQASPWPAGAKVKVSISSARRLSDMDGKARYRVAAGGGSFLLRYDHGDGDVTVLSDASFLFNDRIGELGHAAFAWALVQTDPPPDSIALAFRDEVPSFGALLLSHGWAALLSGAVLLLAWLLHAGARFGPLLPDPPDDRRSLLEHIEASGDFLFRRSHADSLAESVRRALHARLTTRQPVWAKLPRRDLVQRLAALAELPERRVHDALYARAPDDPPGFFQTIRTLEIVRRSL